MTVTVLFQADCPHCGWHTRQADQRWWAEQMDEAHKAVCPAPPPSPTPTPTRAS